MKKLIYLIIFIIIVVAIFLVLRPSNNVQAPQIEISLDPLDATYQISEQAVTLTNGHGEVELVPGSASKMIVDVFGQPTLGDLNDDGTNDAALILTENSGGTGTFYYVTAFINNAGTNAVLLGDRIAPQTLEIKDGLLIANYATRKSTEPMSAVPSVSVSKYLVYQNGLLLDQDLSSDHDLLVGAWQSNEDESFVREFFADGTVVDTYKNQDSADQTGTWSFLDAETGDFVLVLTFPDTELHFSIVTLTPENLILTYLERGNSLSFSKIKK